MLLQSGVPPFLLNLEEGSDGLYIPGKLLLRPALPQMFIRDAEVSSCGRLHLLFCWLSFLFCRLLLLMSLLNFSLCPAPLYFFILLIYDRKGGELSALRLFAGSDIPFLFGGKEEAQLLISSSMITSSA